MISCEYSKKEMITCQVLTDLFQNDLSTENNGRILCLNSIKLRVYRKVYLEP